MGWSGEGQGAELGGGHAAGNRPAAGGAHLVQPVAVPGLRNQLGVLEHRVLGDHLDEGRVAQRGTGGHAGAVGHEASLAHDGPLGLDRRVAAALALALAARQPALGVALGLEGGDGSARGGGRGGRLLAV